MTKGYYRITKAYTWKYKQKLILNMNKHYNSIYCK